jgi:hypothetical protein
VACCSILLEVTFSASARSHKKRVLQLLYDSNGRARS